MLAPELGLCLRRLYGNDAVDRLEAAPAFDELVARIEDPVELVYDRDIAEQARFDAECARDLAGDDE